MQIPDAVWDKISNLKQAQYFEVDGKVAYRRGGCLIIHDDDTVWYRFDFTYLNQGYSAIHIEKWPEVSYYKWLKMRKDMRKVL